MAIPTERLDTGSLFDYNSLERPTFPLYRSHAYLHSLHRKPAFAALPLPP